LPGGQPGRKHVLWAGNDQPQVRRPRLASARVVTEGDMNSLNWNGLIQALVLIRIGQELGTDSRLARALHDLMHALVSVWQ
jgi:hypothetical protein